MATDIIARGMITEYKSGTNISFTENDDGSVTISASGNVSSEDSVARDAINNHKSDTSNPHNVTPAQIGLGNVDNTADLDKPISTAVQTALNGKVDKIDVKDNLESTDTTSPLSANQGKVLNKKITEHTDDSDIHVTASDKENWNSHPNDVTATGNPVQLDGLQGGVPFSEIAVSGKNLLKYPYYNTTKTISGITFTDNGDGTITANGTATATASYFLDSEFNYIGGITYTISGCPKGGSNSTYKIKGDRLGAYIDDNGNGATYSFKYDTTAAIVILIYKDTTVDNIVFRPQLEYGDTATEYEPPITGRELTVNVNGTEYTITPDSNPYVIPNDIRQQDGHNVISVSDGTLSVTSCKDNAAIKRIWDSVGMDLLFDGITSADAPAVVDLAGYDAIEIHHIMVASGVAYPVHIKMPVSDYVNTEFTRISSPTTNSSIITYVTNTDSHISDVYAVSAGGALMLNTKIYGIKE